MSLNQNRKRKHENILQDLWINASNWIENEGGFVHKACTFSLPQRSVWISSGIKKGTIMMKIPKSCHITLNSVEESPIGPQLFRAVNAVDESKIHHNKNDILLAFFLASLFEGYKKESLSLKNKEADQKSMFYHPYLATLPDDTSYDNLPRRWPDKQLEKLLTGTSLLHRARKDREGVKNDYELIAKEWRNEKISTTPDDECFYELPTLSGFDQMLAAVASRGFAALGSDGLDAMVPLLDLLDHKRGAKDVTYARSKEDGSIIVTADRDLEADSNVYDTYGAKGNAQLLNRYGFCLKNNIEPDGSSNDILELAAKANKPPVELRAGPKSYTFGGFVKALEMFHKLPENDGNSFTEDDEEDDMNDFLDNCEGEQMGVCGMYGGEEASDDYTNTNDNDDEVVASECFALDGLIKALESTRDNYIFRGKNLDDALQDTTSLPEHFCAILVQSEMRIIRLYLQAAKAIKKALQKDISKEIREIADEDEKLLDLQANELMTAFLRIRYPLLNI